MNAGSRNPYSGNRFRKALKYFLVGRAAQAVASFGLVLLAVRLLSPTDYGAYVVLLGLVELCRPLSSLGLLPAVQQFLPEMALHASRQQLRSFVRWATALRFLLLAALGLLLLAFWQSLSAWLGFTHTDFDHIWLVTLLIVTMLGAGFNEHILEALLEQRHAQILRALVPVGRVLGLLALAAAGQADLVSILIVDVVVTGCCLLASEIILVRQFKQLNPDGSRNFERGEIARFIWHMSGSQLLNAINSPGALRLVVATALGLEAAGQFAFAQQLIQQAQKFLPSIMFADLIRPMLIAARVSGDRPTVVAAGRLLWKINVVFVYPMLALAAVGGDAFVQLLSGGKIGDASVLLWLLVGLLAAGYAHITTMLLQIHRHTALIRALSLLAVLGPLAAWLGTAYGLMWAAAGVAAVSWLRSSCSLMALARRDEALQQDRRGGLVSILAAVVAFGAGWALSGHSIWLGMVTAVLVYVAGLTILKPLSADDVAIILRLRPNSKMARFARFLRFFAARPDRP